MQGPWSGTRMVLMVSFGLPGEPYLLSPSPAFAASMEDSSSVDDDGLAGHGLRAAHGDHHVGAVVLVGGLLQERARCRILDLLGPEVGCRARAVQETRRDAVDQC